MVFLAHKAGQVRHILQDFVTCAVIILSTARCLHRCVLRPTKAYQDTLQVVQCFLTILQSVLQGGFAVCICYIVVHREHMNAAHT